MRPLLLAGLLLAAPLLTGCIGTDDVEGPNAKADLESQATATEDTGGIEGLVTDPAIQPVAGATVTITETSDTTRTASDGSFAFSNVFPGTYTLRFEADGFISTTTDLVVKAEQITIGDVVMVHEATDKPFLQQMEFTGFVECSVRAGYGVAVCGAINLFTGGNTTNDRFMFTWDMLPGLSQMVTEIEWEANQPAGQWLSFVVEPDGLPNDRQTEFGSIRGESPLVIRTTAERVAEIDANTTAICEGEKEPEDPVISADSEAYCNRDYVEAGGPVQARIFVSGDSTLPVGLGASVQQEYHVVTTMFYNGPACEDFSLFEQNPCDPHDRL